MCVCACLSSLYVSVNVCVCVCVRVCVHVYVVYVYMCECDCARGCLRSLYVMGRLFCRTSGEQYNAKDLTWSYAEVIHLFCFVHLGFCFFLAQTLLGSMMFIFSLRCYSDTQLFVAFRCCRLCKIARWRSASSTEQWRVLFEKLAAGFCLEISCQAVHTRLH